MRLLWHLRSSSYCPRTPPTGVIRPAHLAIAIPGAKGDQRCVVCDCWVQPGTTRTVCTKLGLVSLACGARWCGGHGLPKTLPCGSSGLRTACRDYGCQGAIFWGSVHGGHTMHCGRLTVLARNAPLTVVRLYRRQTPCFRRPYGLALPPTSAIRLALIFSVALDARAD